MHRNLMTATLPGGDGEDSWNVPAGSARMAHRAPVRPLEQPERRVDRPPDPRPPSNLQHPAVVFRMWLTERA